MAYSYLFYRWASVPRPTSHFELELVVARGNLTLLVKVVDLVLKQKTTVSDNPKAIEELQRRASASIRAVAFGEVQSAAGADGEPSIRGFAIEASKSDCMP